VVRPTAYCKTKKGRLLCRQAAFLLSTDLESEAGELMQNFQHATVPAGKRLTAFITSRARNQ
jgi:hypothetical protein